MIGYATYSNILKGTWPRDPNLNYKCMFDLHILAISFPAVLATLAC